MEFLRSTRGVFWLLIPVRVDDIRASTQLVQESLASSILHFRNSQPVSCNPFGNKDGIADFDMAITVVISLLTFLKVMSAILVFLQFELGTNLFERTRVGDQATFWSVTCEFAELVQKECQIAFQYPLKNRSTIVDVNLTVCRSAAWRSLMRTV